MKKAILLLVAASLFASVVSAQDPHDLMPIVVQPDRVMIGKEFVPRCGTMASVLIVPAGQTVEAKDGTFDCIEVAGKLRFSRTRDTRIAVTHVMNLPGGDVDMGTPADPMPAGRKIEIIGRDVPIDTAKDPFQWGNGLLNFGHRTAHGAKKLEWTTLTAEVRKGATVLPLAEIPVGWVVGDELLIPSTEQPPVGTAPPRDAVMRIAAIAGLNVTVDVPLGFDRLAQRDPDGGVVLLPRVANVTRNIIIRSENPAGTPWHMADVGHGAMWDERYVDHQGLGRTRAERLDNTTNEPVHIGTNQVGRYGGGHYHHAMGFGSSTIGGVFRGGGAKAGKWAISLHGTHDARIQRNIGIDFLGAAFVTEDGYEVRDVFAQNFGAYNINPAMLTANPDVALHNVQDLNAPGIEGGCMWLRGTMITLDRNECWANGTGINLFNIAQVVGVYPSAPGGPNDVTFTPITGDSARALPVLVTGNVVASNLMFGWEGWGSKKFPNTNLIASYNGEFQANFVISNPTQVWLVNPTLVGKGGTTKCISSSASYTDTLELDGGRAVGCTAAVIDGGAINLVRITGTFFQNILDLDFGPPPIVLRHENVTARAMPGHAFQHLQFGRQVVWPGPPTPLPGPPSAKLYYYQSGGRSHTIKNWMGTGKDYRLLHPQQLATTLAWPAGFGDAHFFSPEANLTMGQTWAKYGQAWGGEAVGPMQLVTLAGILAPSLVAEGAAIPLGPPRAVLSYPNNFTPTVISLDSGGAPYIGFYGLATGDPAAASPDFVVAVDGGAPITMQSSPDWEGDQRNYGIRTGMTPGPHAVKTWRTTTAGATIAASELSFTYSVGAVVPPLLCTDPKAPNVGQPLPCLPPIVPPIDVCPPPAGPAGVQLTVPMGLVLVNGQCVPPVVTPTITLFPALFGKSADGLHLYWCGTSDPASCKEVVVK